mmetsp:Transcript_2336/g.6958  ORF Transcript_2336/g.6958 Transcript_2336/m.6958 type:complete len:313 (+) Transcript_2336:196-1134(+)
MLRLGHASTTSAPPSPAPDGATARGMRATPHTAPSTPSVATTSTEARARPPAVVPCETPPLPLLGFRGACRSAAAAAPVGRTRHTLTTPPQPMTSSRPPGIQCSTGRTAAAAPPPPLPPPRGRSTKATRCCDPTSYTLTPRSLAHATRSTGLPFGDAGGAHAAPSTGPSPAWSTWSRAPSHPLACRMSCPASPPATNCRLERRLYSGSMATALTGLWYSTRTTAPLLSSPSSPANGDTRHTEPSSEAVASTSPAPSHARSVTAALCSASYRFTSLPDVSSRCTDPSSVPSARTFSPTASADAVMPSLQGLGL